ncbi:MAG TPA: subtype I-C CRISPR-associated endonuclease Cas1 [Lentisphaeria bacterium]|nr:MAG: subtype I-C CRISPR-associated endonuclease Cas1 [Lentisphaerae bacterium GWF2_49_21]HBC89779.1 subtype I-C CRISPR-associated endonuclease Cas1 [Lentisphaeria bacterium]
MKKLLNTLFVTTQGAYLSKEGECVIVSVEREVKLRLPIHTIGGIVCFGQISMSPQLMGFCTEKNVLVSFLSEHGKFFAKVQGPVSGNVLLRKAQYRFSDDVLQSANIARHVLAGKLCNCRTVLNRFLRDHGDSSGDIEAVSRRIDQQLERLRTIQELDEIRGVEGDLARSYFSVFDRLITSQKEDFKFEGRNKRPPMDNTNALLSFIYTLLAHDVQSALETVGLDPAVGFLHRDRPGRAGLALDLMEELRPFFADRLVLSLINLQRVNGTGFRKMEGGAVVMDDATRKEVLMAYQERKKDELTHPFIDEKINVGLIPYVQAMLFARFIRGDLDSYPPFIWK